MWATARQDDRGSVAAASPPGAPLPAGAGPLVLEPAGASLDPAPAWPCAWPGGVPARLADPGDLAVPGKPLLRVVRQSAVRVRGSIPPELMTRLRPGTPVDLTLGDERVKATVSRIFPAMQGSHLATFEIDVRHPTPGYVAGATVGVDLHLQSGAGLLVPLDALLEGDAGTHAFVVDHAGDGSPTLRAVALTVTTRSLDQAVVEGRVPVGRERAQDLGHVRADGLTLRPRGSVQAGPLEQLAVRRVRERAGLDVADPGHREESTCA